MVWGKQPPPEKTPAAQPGGPLAAVEVAETHHLSPLVAAITKDWFAGRVAPLALDGNRSVLLTYPGRRDRRLKIKGAGVRGRGVQFGTHHATGPAAPVFDFEGRMMEDIAAGHDGAFEGGASFQQAANEYRMTERLSALGYDVVPCLGWGRVDSAEQSSWFCVFDLEDGLAGDTTWPEAPLEEWLHLNTAIGPLMTDLAVKHGLTGYIWYMRRKDGGWLIKDLHPLRKLEPENMSQISWVMQVFFALHVRGNSARMRLQDPRLPRDLHVWQYRAFCPDVTLADHDELRERLVAPYMLRPPQEFRFPELLAILRGNKITAALMDLCPPEFARP
jgi:hypothetical protein